MDREIEDLKRRAGILDEGKINDRISKYLWDGVKQYASYVRQGGMDEEIAMSMLKKNGYPFIVANAVRAMYENPRINAWIPQDLSSDNFNA